MLWRAGQYYKKADVKAPDLYADEKWIADMPDKYVKLGHGPLKWAYAQ